MRFKSVADPIPLAEPIPRNTNACSIPLATEWLGSQQSGNR